MAASSRGSGGFEDGTSTTVGEGTLILSGPNTYGGPTLIACGTLRLGANGSLPSGTPLTVASAAVGGTFDMNAHSQSHRRACQQHRYRRHRH